ncbi:uncharacterized protein LOC114297432 [Camellia sinensis]|uniref:uncharacterized protein LOC114297432 n=1 Tax=Camellia sinensis TaxID=4442 RepID=UPI0010361A21|nr:uncharacterized protein LOC114297432 [Camellia sinensis]
MTQPPGFVSSSSPHHVCKLQKALYGLKQAPRAWYYTFSKFLLSQGFVNSHYDNSLFIHKTSTTITVLLMYVDDILLIGNSPSHLQALIHQMHSAFAMQESGDLSYFLGISIQAMGDTYFLSQSKYASEILLKAGMTSCKPCPTPMSMKPVDTLAANLPFHQPQLYRSLVGALQYLTLTRPDFSFAVNQACQYMHAPTNAYFALLKPILRFVQVSLSHGLTFCPSSFELQVFSDSNWTGDTIDHKSTSGYCVFLGSNLISWSAKKQPTVSRSSTEVEYRSLAHATAELSWLQMLLHDLSLPLVTTPLLLCDNLSAIALASNHVFHTGSKHIEVDCHFIRDKIASKKLLLHYIPSAEQITDVFTKPLSVARFQYLQSKLLVTSPPISLQGDDKTSSALAVAAELSS